MFRKPWEARKPAVNNRLSPGKKNPKNNPDSAKIIKKRPAMPIIFTSDSSGGMYLVYII